MCWPPTSITFPIRIMSRPNDIAGHGSPWYRQPIAWLGIGVFLAILGGCIWTVTISARYTDVDAYGNAPKILGVPAPSTAKDSEQP